MVLVFSHRFSRASQYCQHCNTGERERESEWDENKKREGKKKNVYTWKKRESGGRRGSVWALNKKLLHAWDARVKRNDGTRGGWRGRASGEETRRREGRIRSIGRTERWIERFKRPWRGPRREEERKKVQPGRREGWTDGWRERGIKERGGRISSNLFQA